MGAVDCTGGGDCGGFFVRIYVESLFMSDPRKKAKDALAAAEKAVSEIPHALTIGSIVAVVVAFSAVLKALREVLEWVDVIEI